MGETALQPTAFVAAKPWQTPRFREVKRKKRKWKIKNGKRELRSPDGTEPDKEVGEARAAADALRATANVGVVAPEAAAQQTIRTSRGSCGVGHAY